jgi:hypothetical protein
MPENMMNSAQKSNSKLFDQNYDLIFRKKPAFDPRDFDCANYGCQECPNGEACTFYLNNKYDLNL